MERNPGEVAKGEYCAKEKFETRADFGVLWKQENYVSEEIKIDSRLYKGEKDHRGTMQWAATDFIFYRAVLEHLIIMWAEMCFKLTHRRRVKLFVRYVYVVPKIMVILFNCTAAVACPFKVMVLEVFSKLGRGVLLAVWQWSEFRLWIWKDMKRFWHQDVFQQVCSTFAHLKKWRRVW